MGKAYKKAQSAMEYLMTYGWAILIIAIVLAALFSLGVFSSSSFLGTTCVASSGYLCQSPLLHAGNFMFTFGQSTGTAWSNAEIFFVESGAATPTAAPSNANAIFSLGSFNSGQSIPVTLPGGVTGASDTYAAFNTAAGNSYSGALWVSYTVGANTGLLSLVATVTLKSTGFGRLLSVSFCFKD